MTGIAQLWDTEKQLCARREDYSAIQSDNNYMALCQWVGYVRGSNTETVERCWDQVLEFMKEAPQDDKDVVLKLSKEVLDNVTKTRNKFNELNMFWDANMDMLLVTGI